MDKANGDIAPQRKRWSLPRPQRWLWVTLITLSLVLLASAGAVAYATLDFKRAHEDRLLPGIALAGVDVGGLARDQALAAVERAVDPELTRAITLTWRGKSWKVTPEELGARSDAAELVDAAFDRSASASLVELARMRLLDAGLGYRRSATITYSPRATRRFVANLARRFDRDAADATIDYSTGWVEVVPEREGRRLRVRPTTRALLTAMKEGSGSVPLKVATTPPEVTREAFETVLLLRIGENKLYYYRDGKIRHTWTVATGLPEYPTPTGIFHVELKRYMPTWVNPDPEGWGADMPKVIPPGPDNPLGTRALNWTAPGIRFHGTSATYSLGHNASHGCVRMAMSDVEFLYDIVEVGTPIVSVEVGGYSPLYESSEPVTEGA